MPTYRRMNCVERSISLWCEQTFKDSELIIFNTDAENLITLGESLQGQRIKVVNNSIDYCTEQPYSEVGSIRRDALFHATGDYYICWDDDDIFLPWNNQQCFDRINANPEIWAWKPIVSMCHLGGKGIEIAGNVMEASIISRLDKIREFGFESHPGGGEHMGWYYGFGDKLKVDEYSVPAYSFNWADPPEIAGHKNSSSISDDNNFERHKASCTDIHTRPMERIDVTGIIEEYKIFLRGQPQLFPELVTHYVNR
jgi:glycosyltransferase involved in cell wall biosynthesis